MDAAGTLDSTTWAALALVLTLLGAALSWLAWRRRGAAAGLRGLAWTLVPVAAWLTGTLRLAVEVVDDVVRWASRLVFSPSVWAGLVVLGVAVVLWFVSGAMRERGVGVRGRAATRAVRRGRRVEAHAPEAVGAAGTPAPGTGRSAAAASAGEARPAARTGGPTGRKAAKPAAPPSGKASGTRHESDLDDMDDIEAILKRHGI